LSGSSLSMADAYTANMRSTLLAGKVRRSGGYSWALARV
jgi:hypothetical protein